MSEFAPMGVGNTDTSGTWTHGLVIGSPEWVDANLRMGLAKSLMDGETSPEELMGIFDTAANAGEEI